MLLRWLAFLVFSGVQAIMLRIQSSPNSSRASHLTAGSGWGSGPDGWEISGSPAVSVKSLEASLAVSPSASVMGSWQADWSAMPSPSVRAYAPNQPCKHCGRRPDSPLGRATHSPPSPCVTRTVGSRSGISVHGLCLCVGTLLRGSVREQVAQVRLDEEREIDSLDR